MYQFSLLKRLIVLHAFLLGSLAAQDAADIDFKISVDLSRFSIEGGVYVDIYLLIPQSVFTFKDTENGVEAQVVFQTALVQGDSVPYPPDRWQRTYRAKDHASIASMSWVPDISKFFVEPGDYELQIDIVDVHSKKQQTLRKAVSLEIFPSDTLTISDITIASQIVKAKGENEFTKYGYDVVPNAQRTFTVNSPMMYYYLEAYGLSGTGNYNIHAQVLSLNEKVVQDFPVRTKKMPGSSVVEWGGVNTAGLASGIFKLVVTIGDEVTGQTATQKRTFYILRPTSRAKDEAEMGGEYDELSASQIDDIYRVVKLVMNKNEKKLYRRSDDVGKRNVLTAFWKRNDPDPETAGNEFKQEFYQRVQMANREFGSETEEGWGTDRGRVLIKYGKPSNIERQQSSLARKPYVTWEYYDIEGGVHFVFVDRTGYGSYQLVHSDARNEVQDYDWKRFLE